MKTRHQLRPEVPANQSVSKARVFMISSGSTLVALILLCLGWELWLSPLRPGGSWLVLKVLSLLFPLRGILHGRRYTYQWSSMLILTYFAEGIVRAMSESGSASILAATEILFSIGF